MPPADLQNDLVAPEAAALAERMSERARKCKHGCLVLSCLCPNSGLSGTRAARIGQGPYQQASHSGMRIVTLARIIPASLLAQILAKPVASVLVLPSWSSGGA